MNPIVGFALSQNGDSERILVNPRLFLFGATTLPGA